MTNQITTVSSMFSTPYLTNAEFKQAPTAVDVDDLVGGGTQAINDQELTNVIARASSWIDSHCGQVLAATTDTESMRSRISRQGMLTVHPRYSPVSEVVSLSYGPYPQIMTSVDVSQLWIEPESITFPIQGYSASFLGPIQFSGSYSANQEQFVTFTYVNGYANTVLTASVSASATSLPVQDLSGFMPGQRFQIFDGSSTEICTVASTFVPASGAGNVTLAAHPAYSHATGLAVSALPPAVKQAAIYITSAILKARGNATLVMASLTPNQVQSTYPASGNDLNAAWDILKPFRRIR